MYRFSIIVPCYNVEEYLESCIESIEKQEFHNYEVLLINDGSTDSTVDIAKRLCGKYSNIRYFEKANGGLSHTRNYGIDRAEGEYLYFLDSDDMLDKADVLSKLNKSIAEAGGPDVIITRYRELDDKTKLIGEKKCFSDRLKDSLTIKEKYKLCYLSYDIKPMASISIVKRSYILANKLYFKEKIVHEDELWTPQVFLNSKSIGFLDESCYIYRINRAGSIMNKITEKNIYDRLRVIAELEILADKQPEYAEMYKSRCACILNGIYGMKANELSSSVMSAINEKTYVFKNSIQKKYLIMYFLVRLIGVKNTIKLVSFIKSR